MLRKTQRIRCTFKVTEKKPHKNTVDIHHVCYCMPVSCYENYHSQSIRYEDVNGISQLKQCILISQFLNGNYIYFLPKVLNKCMYVMLLCKLCTVSSISPLNSDVFPFSFVRSVSMDKWKDSELEKMKAGGNRKALEFFQSQSDFSDGMSIQDKYNSKAAALLRDKV